MQMQNNQLQRSRSPYQQLPPQMVQSQQLTNPKQPFNQYPQQFTQPKQYPQQPNYTQPPQNYPKPQQNTIPPTQIFPTPQGKANPQSARNVQMNVDPSKILNNIATQSPIGPQSVKSNKSWSGQKPAFVEYYPPVFVPHPEPMITQTIIEKPIQVVDLIQFEDIWNKRIKGLEDMLAARPQVEQESIELRAGQNDGNSEKVIELQNELYNVKSQLEDRDKEIMDLKAQLQQAIEQLEFDKLQNRKNQASGMAELQLKISSLQQMITNLQLDLKKTSESADRYRIENNQLQTERQYFKDQCDEKDDQISQLQQEIEELRQHIEQLSEEVTTTSSVKTYEEEAKIWKQKFKELNDTYHACQEKLMVRDAEYESLLKSQSQQKIITQTVVKQSSSQRSVKNESDYLQNSLTGGDIERLKEVSKPLMM